MATSAARWWQQRRTYHHADFPAQLIAAERQETVSVCLPARECAATIEDIVGELQRLRRAGAIDDIVVIDADSRDGTAARAASAGARVYSESELMSDFGPVEGKGDAMWRALSVIDSDIVCYADADSAGFGAHFVSGVLGPLVCAQTAAIGGVEFVKGFYRRPIAGQPEGGGRVNHMTARPALALMFAELAGFQQPLAGEVAARRALLERLPFTTGYGVEVAMLIDAWRVVGLDAMAQVDIGVHNNRHKTLDELVPMAYAVLQAVLARAAPQAAGAGPLLDRDGIRQVQLRERPPMASQRPALGAEGAA